MDQREASISATNKAEITTLNVGPRVNAAVVASPSALNQLSSMSLQSLASLGKWDPPKNFRLPVATAAEVKIGKMDVAEEISTFLFLKPDDVPASNSSNSSFIWTVPSPPASYVKRDKLFALDEMLEKQPLGKSCPTVVVTGYPGVGKTNGVYDYASSHHPHGDSKVKYNGGAYMFDAGNPQKLFESYKEFSHRLGIITKTEIKELNFNSTNRKKLIEAVNVHLQNCDRMLLFFDNATDYHSIKEYLPVLEQRQAVPHHILITSFNNEWNDFSTIFLPHFFPQEAKNYIKKVYETHSVDKNASDESINYFVEMLNYYPLGLSQAINTIITGKEEVWTIDLYIQLYTEKSSLFRKEKVVDAPALGDSEKTIRITWRLAMERLKQTTPQHSEQIQKIFETLSYFKADKISTDFIFEFCSSVFNWDKKTTTEILILCYRFSLLEFSQINNRNDSVILHQIFHNTLQFERTNSEKIQTRLIKFCIEQFSYNQFLETSFDRWWKIYSHFDYLINNILAKQSALSTEELMFVINLMGFYIFEQANTPAAEQLREKIHDLVETQNTTLSLQFQGRYFLYWLMCLCGNKHKPHQEMVNIIDKALAFFNESTSQENILFIMTMQNLSSIYYNITGQPDKALYASEKSISLFLTQRPRLSLENNFGHLRVYFKVYLTYGKLLLANGDYSKAKSLLYDLFTFLERMNLSKRYPQYHHRIVMFLGHAEANLGKYQKAEEYYALGSNFSSNNIKTTDIYWRETHYFNNMGELYYLKGEYSLACVHYKNAAERLYLIYGEKPSNDGALITLDLTAVHFATKHITEGSQMLSNSERMCDEIFGNNCKNILRARILFFHGFHHKLQGNNSDAANYFSESHKLFNEIKAANNRYYGELLLQYGSFLYEQNKKIEAKQYLSSAVQLLPSNCILSKQAEKQLRRMQTYTISKWGYLSLLFILIIYLLVRQDILNKTSTIKLQEVIRKI